MRNAAGNAPGFDDNLLDAIDVSVLLKVLRMDCLVTVHSNIVSLKVHKFFL